MSVSTLGAATRSVGLTSAPRRTVSFPGDCPPNGPGKARFVRPPDADVNGDGRTDYFMGAWSFADAGGNGLVVRLWCMGRKRSRRRFNDYYALQVSTSSDANVHEATKIRPSGPLCPFVRGENLDTGFARHRCLGIQQPPFTAVPARIDWTAVNPHAPGDDAPGIAAVQTILWPMPDHEVIRGRIVKTRRGRFRFRGAFKLGEAVKPGVDLTDADRQELMAEFAAKRAGARTLAACARAHR